MERKIVFWDCRDSEILSHTDPDEAVEDLLSDGPPYPGLLKLKGYARMELPSASRMVSDILEYLDEHILYELSDPEGNQEGVLTKPIEEAAKVFIDVVCKEFTPWACEVVHETEINVRDWVKANNPEEYEEMFGSPVTG